MSLEIYIISIYNIYIYIYIYTYMYQLRMPSYENVKLEFIQKDIFLLKISYISVSTKTFLRLCIKQNM